MITLFIDNSLTTTNKIVNTTGNQVTNFYKPTIILDDKKKYELRLVSASIVYCVPNITSKNNKLVYKTSDNVTHTFLFDSGLYSLDDINLQIALFTMKLANGNDMGLLSFSPDQATSKIYVTFSSANTSIDCSQSTVMQTLGFPIDMDNDGNSNSNGIIGNFSYKNGMVKSTQKAYLNPIQSFLVQTNITTGNYLGSDPSSIIASIPINVLPGSTIQYTPVHPIRTLINVKHIYDLTITLLDQFGDMIDMGTNNGDNVAEDWSVCLSITELTDASL